MPTCVRCATLLQLWTALLMLFLCSVNHYNGNEVTSIVYSRLSPRIIPLLGELFAMTFDVIIRQKINTTLT